MSSGALHMRQQQAVGGGVATSTGRCPYQVRQKARVCTARRRCCSESVGGRPAHHGCSSGSMASWAGDRRLLWCTCVCLQRSCHARVRKSCPSHYSSLLCSSCYFRRPLAWRLRVPARVRYQRLEAAVGQQSSRADLGGRPSKAWPIHALPRHAGAAPEVFRAAAEAPGGPFSAIWRLHCFLNPSASALSCLNVVQQGPQWGLISS